MRREREVVALPDEIEGFNAGIASLAFVQSSPAYAEQQTTTTSLNHGCSHTQRRVCNSETTIVLTYPCPCPIPPHSLPSHDLDLSPLMQLTSMLRLTRLCLIMIDPTHHLPQLSLSPRCTLAREGRQYLSRRAWIRSERLREGGVDVGCRVRLGVGDDFAEFSSDETAEVVEVEVRVVVSEGVLQLCTYSSVSIEESE